MFTFWLNTIHTIPLLKSSRRSRGGRLACFVVSFLKLLKLPSLWTHSYLFDTTDKVSTQKVLQYINDPHHG